MKVGDSGSSFVVIRSTGPDQEWEEVSGLYYSTMKEAQGEIEGIREMYGTEEKLFIMKVTREIVDKG
jgi:hypothetical protein